MARPVKRISVRLCALNALSTSFGEMPVACRAAGLRSTMICRYFRSATAISTISKNCSELVRFTRLLRRCGRVRPRMRSCRGFSQQPGPNLRDLAHPNVGAAAVRYGIRSIVCNPGDNHGQRPKEKQPRTEKPKAVKPKPAAGHTAASKSGSGSGLKK
jgi:hypothetical protein